MVGVFDITFPFLGLPWFWRCTWSGEKQPSQETEDGKQDGGKGEGRNPFLNLFFKHFALKIGIYNSIISDKTLYFTAKLYERLAMVLIVSFQRSKSKREESEPSKFCCIPCSRPLSEECGTCKYCKDKPKYGGTYILRQKCILRTCVNKKKSIKTSSQKYKNKWMMNNPCFIYLLWKIYEIILKLNVNFAVKWFFWFLRDLVDQSIE